MVLAFWGDPRSEAEIASLLGTKPFGTPISNATRLRAWNYDVSVAEQMQRATVESHLDEGTPVIARIWTAMLDYWQQATSHVVVIVGYDEERVIVNDPALADGTRAILWDAFLAAWAEFDETAVIIHPA